MTALRFTRRAVALAMPLVTSYGTLTHRTLFDVELEGDDGVIGRGEAAPLEPYDSVPDGAVAAALTLYAEVLREHGDDVPGHLLLDACRAAAELPEALAAVDLAMWDRAGRRTGRPVRDLLGQDGLGLVAVNATVGALAPAAAAEAAARAAADGFACVKLKVGTPEDRTRVAAVREAMGPEPALRLDANGAWSVEQAVEMIGDLAGAGLELVEEPVHGLEAVRAVRDRVTARVSIDESAAAPGALTARVADAVCLKISRCGGIAGLVSQATLVRATGADVYVASTYDGPLGIAAAVHAAAALRVGLPCGLATLGGLELEAPEALRVGEGVIAVPAGPGLL